MTAYAGLPTGTGRNAGKWRTSANGSASGADPTTETTPDTRTSPTTEMLRTSEMLQTPVPFETGTPEETPAVSVPPRRSDCIADSAGGLTFDLVDCGTAGGADGSWDAALVLRGRGANSTLDEVRLPLVPAGDGRLRAVLPSTMALPEGRWDAYAEVGGSASAATPGEPDRLLPGILDLRSLVDRRPDTDRPSVAVRIPYATKHDNLSIRSWLRTPHAEAGELRLSDGVMTVQGRLFGASAGTGALAEARSRRHPSVVRTVPASVEDTVRDGATGHHFAFTLAFKELVEAWQGGREPWDLWLRPAPDEEPVRVARILDDVPDKKHIFTYPVQPLTCSEHGTAEAGPYYTADNDLAVRVAPAGESGDDEPN